MLKVLSIVGTRPEAIKMAPVIRRLACFPDRVRSVVCVTAQHREMLDEALALFDIVPDYDLEVMEEDQALPTLTASILTRLSNVLERERSGLVLVQGDTTSAVTASLAAFYYRIPVGHIEAGLRTGNRYYPFPEEINRRLLSVLATLHFAPTQTAVDALLAEGFPPQDIYLTGNTVVDALLSMVREDCLDLGVKLGAGRTILVTAHRRENFGQPLEDICFAVREIARRNPGVEVVYPVHPNPRVKEVAYRILSGQERVHLIAPLRYEKFVHLMAASYLVLTDSGGIQEEAPVLGKPVLVLRMETERPEAVAAGAVRVVGTSSRSIIEQVERLLNDEAEYAKMSQAVSPYGDGKAAERIVDIILRWAERQERGRAC